MEYTVYGDKITIDPGIRHIGNIFQFTGKNLLRLGLPNNFFFQLPDKFAFQIQENINQEDQLINTLPITNGMCVLIKYIREWIQNGVSISISTDRG